MSIASHKDMEQSFPELVEEAVRQGKKGRRELIAQLSRLPVDRLAQLSPDVLAMIGPAGLAELAETRSDLTGLAPCPTVPVRKSSSASVGPKTNRSANRNESRVFWICCGILALALSVDFVMPVIRGFGTAGTLPRSADLWETCPRLDPDTDGCVYTTAANSLRLLDAAAYLSLPIGKLRMVNQHIIQSDDQPLPQGSRIVVLRDLARLEGGKQ